LLFAKPLMILRVKPPVASTTRRRNMKFLNKIRTDFNTVRVEMKRIMLWLSVAVGGVSC